jgi:hypothetical protein
MTRSEAARLNGSKSRGPVTEAGKARSARNAMKHGLTAKSFLLPLEDPSAFEELHAAYLEEFSPQSIAEQDCVEEMVAAVYRQRRLWALDTASLINRMDMMAIDVDLKYKSIPPANRIALAFDSRAAAKCAPDLYLRYDAHLSRAYDPPPALRTHPQPKSRELHLPPSPKLRPHPCSEPLFRSQAPRTKRTRARPRTPSSLLRPGRRYRRCCRCQPSSEPPFVRHPSVFNEQRPQQHPLFVGRCLCAAAGPPVGSHPEPPDLSSNQGGQDDKPNPRTRSEPSCGVKLRFQRTTNNVCNNVPISRTSSNLHAGN